jgi:uncharacterized protein (DUF3084 family)
MSQELMKLADKYARLNAQTTAPGAYDARAALQSAIESLQEENERLKEEAKQWQSLSELSLGMAEAHSKQRDALAAKLVPLEADAERLDWLEQNIFNRENVDWVTGKVSKTHNMWVMFAPVGVQGSARRIIDAAKGGQQ